MTTHHIAITPGVIVEQVGNDCVVLLPGHEDVIRLTGKASSVVRQVQAGHRVVVSDPAVLELIDLGVIQSGSTLSRRGVVRAGFVGAGVGIAALALPSVASASSTPGGGGGGGGGLLGDGSLSFNQIQFALTWPRDATPPWNANGSNISGLTVNDNRIGVVPFYQIFNVFGTGDAVSWVVTGLDGPTLWPINVNFTGTFSITGGDTYTVTFLGSMVSGRT